MPAAAIALYLAEGGKRFDEAISADGEAYADQCRHDHQRLFDVLAIGAGSGAGC